MTKYRHITVAAIAAGILAGCTSTDRRAVVTAPQPAPNIAAPSKTDESHAQVADVVSKAETPTPVRRTVKATGVGVQWQPDWDSATSVAKLEHKPIMVDLYTDWCVWCKKLDSDVYPTKTVGAAAAQFVSVRLDAEKTEAGHKLAEHFGITGFPAVLFLDSDGSPVGFIGGFAPPAKFAETMNEIGQDYRDYPALVAKVKANPGDATAAVRLAEIDINRASPADALTVADALTQHGGGAKAASLYNTVADYYNQTEQYETATQIFQKALSYGRNRRDVVVAAHMGLVTSYGGQHKAPELDNELVTLIQLPDTPSDVKERARKIRVKLRQMGLLS